jgi:hypothetical protein
MLRITINHDSGMKAPWLECDGSWRVISNNSRSELYENKESFFTIGFRRKLNVGLAFPLSKYEHGGVVWSLLGQGTQCRWDTVVNAGFLVWDHKPRDMGAKTYEDRLADAQRFLEVFNSFVNGECFCYKLERVTACESCGSWVTEELGGCGGFIGGDHLFDDLRELMGEYAGEEYEFAGDCAYLGDYRLLEAKNG